MTVTCSSCCSSDPEVVSGTSKSWMNHSSSSNSGPSLLPSGLSQRGLCEFIFPGFFSASLNSWLHGWVNSSTALQAVPALLSLVSKVPLRDSPSQICLRSKKQAATGSDVLPAGNMATLSWVCLWNAWVTLSGLLCCRRGSGVSCQRPRPSNEPFVVEKSYTGL